MGIRTENLNSTAIAYATYNDETEELMLGFVSGQTYTYHNVPPDVFEGLIRSGSPGRYFHLNIKDRF